ncbi:MAG: division/cell wall cluster transcriptional repressor MraZ, partial [Nitratireductor sp.]
HTGIETDVAFVGRGYFFQIWQPERLKAYGSEVRARLAKLRQSSLDRPRTAD